MTRAAMPHQLLELPSARGPVRCAYHPAEGVMAVIMVGGGDGGLDGPAAGLYPDLSETLRARGISALRLDFRIHRSPATSIPGCVTSARGSTSSLGRASSGRACWGTLSAARW